MKTKFENKTAYTLECYEEFNRYHMNHRFISYGIIVLLCFLFITSVYNFIRYQEKEFLLYSAIYFIIGVANYFMNYIIVKFALKSAAKKDNTLGTDTNTYYFYEKEMKAKDSREEITYSYQDIWKIKSNKRYIFLYIASNSAFIIDKNGFTKGDMDEFMTFIHEKIKK